MPEHDLFGGLPRAITFKTIDGREVEYAKRGKYYVEPRGYYAKPGTGPAGETCGSCRHHVTIRYSKRYHKCALARGKWTGGRASDILVRASACIGWEGRDEADVKETAR